jgi:hypothetical protein
VSGVWSNDSRQSSRGMNFQAMSRRLKVKSATNRVLEINAKRSTNELNDDLCKSYSQTTEPKAATLQTAFFFSFCSERNASLSTVDE